MIRILFIGDVVGKPGRRVVRSLLPEIKERYKIDFTIANGENAAGGAGLTRKVADELHNYGINVLTSGNHIWDNRDIFSFIDSVDWVLRPYNYPPEAPGRGYGVFESRRGIHIAVINIMGRLFTGYFDCPFRAIENVLEKDLPGIKIIDFHAETTAEKQSFAFYVDGRVTAVIGTHTHVQTSDARILPKGTAYITDVGMTGGLNSVIGVKKELYIKRFKTLLPVAFEPSKERLGLEGVVLSLEEASGKVIDIFSIRELLDE